MRKRLSVQIIKAIETGEASPKLRKRLKMVYTDKRNSEETRRRALLILAKLK